MRWTMSVLVALAALILPASASAETTAIGNPLTHSFNFSFGACPAGCTGVQVTQAAGGPALSSPVNGAVTQWSVRTGQIGATYRLRVLRPVSGLTYTFAGSSAVSPAVPDAMDLIRNYASSVPIQQGDRVGLEAVSGPGVPLHTGPPATIADTWAFTSTSPNDGSSQLFAADVTTSREVLLQATISFCRVPSVVGQTLTAAQTAITAATCASTVTKQQLRLKRIKKSFSKKKKAEVREQNAKLKAQNGTVLAQSIATGTTVEPGRAVGLTVGELVKPKKKKKKKKK